MRTAAWILLVLSLVACDSNETLEGQVRPLFSVGAMMGFGDGPTEPTLVLITAEGEEYTLVFDEDSEGFTMDKLDGGLALMDTSSRFRVTGTAVQDGFLVATFEQIDPVR